ncbi:MAG: TonB-dependent receptor [Verrucomicrobiota bacterium]
MKLRTFISSFVALRCCQLAVALGVALSLSSALHAQASTGAVSGRVQNEVTGQYLNNARVTVKGTELSALTDETGTFRISGVPAGTTTLETFYSGMDPLQVSVNVSAGQTVERDIGLTNKALYGNQPGTVKLDAFVLSASKVTEGEALATNEQRFAPNIKNVVATDAFGDVTEGNVAEFMKFLPGVSVDYSDVMPVSVSVRGFDPALTNVTSDGGSLANSSRNSGSRGFDFMQVSINNISRIEVTKLPLPSNPASGLSGSVNMVSKSAFERSRAQLNYRVFVSASSDGLQLKKQPFPFDTYERRVNPGFDFDYTLPITKNFGIVLTALHSKAWNEQNISQMTWNGTAAGTGATAARPYLQTHNIIDAPKWYNRNSTGLKMDWRPAPHSVLSLGLQATYYQDVNGNVSRATSVGTNAVPAPVTGVPLTYDEDSSNSATGRGTVTFASNFLRIDARTLGSNLRYRLRSGDWNIDTGAYASTSKTWLRFNEKGYFNTMGIALLNTAGVRVNFDDIRPERPGTIRAFDATNREIDLYDIRNFRLNTATSGTYRDHDEQVYGGDVNAKRSLKFLPFPTTIKAGLSYKWQDRDNRRFSRAYTYNPVSAADPTPAPFQAVVYRNRQNYFGFDNLPWPSPSRAVTLWGENPALFTQTVAQQVATEASRITGRESFNETIDAYYVEFEARPVHKLTVVTGVRYETLHDWAAGPLFEPGNAFQRDANGNFLRNTLGQRIRRPEAGAAGSLQELPFIRTMLGRTINTEYDGFYPSIHFTYDVTDSLKLRLAYARTYGRPDLIDVIPNATITENDVSENADPSVLRGNIIVSNPNLKPWISNNYDFSAEYYTETGGVISAGLFRRDIANFFDDLVKLATPEDLELLGLDPRYEGWMLNSTVNGGDARVTGGEFNLRQSLIPLGPWGKMFTVFANATKLRLEGSRTASFTRFIPLTVNWGLNFTRKPFTLSLNWHHRGEQRREPSPAQAADAFLYQQKRTTLDINATFQATKRVSLFLNGRNVLNQHFNLLRYGSETPGYAKVSSTNSYGVQWTAGVKGSF